MLTLHGAVAMSAVAETDLVRQNAMCFVWAHLMVEDDGGR